MYQIDKIQTLRIGVQGENNATNIEIDMSSWANAFPDAQFHVLFKPYNSAYVYPMTSLYDSENQVLTWKIGAAATAVVGVGYTEIRAQDSNGLIKKTRIIPTVVEDSVSGIETDPPEAQEEWVTDVLNAGTDAKNSAAAAMAYSQGKQIKFEIGDDDDPDGMAGHLLFYFKDEDEEDWEDYLDCGPVDVYAMAVATGYTGTKAQWVQSMNDAESNAQKAEKYAVGKVNGTDVGSTDPTYHNNSKYYSEQAAGSATDANAAKVAAQAAQSAAETAAQTNLVEWLEQNITNPDSPPLDRTLSSSSAATPADITGVLNSASNYYEDVELIQYIYGYRILVPNSGTTVDMTPQASSDRCYGIFNCSAGDKFIINGTSIAGNARLWIFVDSNNTLLSCANSGASASGLELVAPENAAKLIVNNVITTANKVCTKGIPKTFINENDLDELKAEIQENNKAISFGNYGLHDIENMVDYLDDADVISFTYGYKIDIPSSGTTVNLTPIESDNRCYAIVDCSAGDEFLINGTSIAGNTRLWIFVDSNNTLISCADSGYTAVNRKLTAPANSAKIIINNVVTAENKICYKGTTLKSVVHDQVEQLEKTNDTLKSTKTATEYLTDSYIVEYTYGYRILVPSSGTTVNLTPQASADRCYAIIDCSAGDKFVINGTSIAGNARLWIFIDSNNQLLSCADSGASANNLIITAPQSASKLIINNVITSEDKACIKGTAIKEAIEQVESEIESIQTDIENLDIGKVNIPLDGESQPTYGNAGEVLRTKGNGGTEWAVVGQPSDEQTADAIEAWLDAHPDATTTVNFNVVDKIFDNVASMISDLTLKNGDNVRTKGYYTIGDGGGADYKIVSTAPSTKYESLSNNLYAQLVIDNECNVKQYGACGYSDSTDRAGIQSAITDAILLKLPVHIPSGKYGLDDSIEVVSNLFIFGDGEKTVIDCQNSLIATTKPIFVNGSNDHLSNFTLKDIYTNYGSSLLENPLNNKEINTSVFENVYSYNCSDAIIKSNRGFEVNNLINCRFYSSENGIRVLSGTANLNNFTNCWFSLIKNSYIIFAGYGQVNNFYGCVFEGSYYDQAYDEAISISLNDCYNTQFNGCYFENCHRRLLVETGTSRLTKFDSCRFTFARDSRKIQIPFEFESIKPITFNNNSVQKNITGINIIQANYQPTDKNSSDVFFIGDSDMNTIISQSDHEFTGITKTFFFEQELDPTEIINVFGNSGDPSTYDNLQIVFGKISVMVSGVTSNGDTQDYYVEKYITVKKIGGSSSLVVNGTGQEFRSTGALATNAPFQVSIGTGEDKTTNFVPITLAVSSNPLTTYTTAFAVAKIELVNQYSINDYKLTEYYPGQW